MRLGQCNGCRMGDHKRHQRVVRAGPEGGVGGVVCDCEGECRENYDPARLLREMGWLRDAEEKHGGT